MKQFQEQNDSIEICYPHFSGSWENYKIKDGKCPVCQKSYVKGENFCSLMEFLDKSTTIENLLEKQGKNRTLILFAKSVLYGENKYIYKGNYIYIAIYKRIYYGILHYIFNFLVNKINK